MDEIDVSAAEAKINEVLVYRKFINFTQFPEGWDSDEIGVKVQKEVINFIKGRINDLMGLSTGKKLDPSFSDDEIKALKVLASRIVNQASGVVEEEQEEEEVEVEPVVEETTAPPSVVKVSKIPKPTKPIKVAKKIKTKTPTITVLPNDQDIIEEGGEKYRIKLAEVNLKSCTGADAKLVENLKQNECVTLSDGALVGKRGVSYFKVGKFKLAGQSPTFDRDAELLLSQQGALGVARSGQEFMKNFEAMFAAPVTGLLDEQDTALSRMDDL